MDKNVTKLTKYAFQVFTVFPLNREPDNLSLKCRCTLKEELLYNYFANKFERMTAIITKLVPLI